MYTPETYVAVVVRRAHAIVFAKNRHAANAADIAQAVALQFLADVENIMANYEPEVFAAVAVKLRSHDFHRSERVQTGQGARLHVDANGDKNPGRRIVVLETVTEFGEAPLAGHVDFASDLVGALDLHEAIALLNPRDQKLVHLVYFEDLSVTDAAALMGVGRTHASRRLSAARDFIADHVMAA